MPNQPMGLARPPKLWIAKKFFTEKLSAIASWRPPKPSEIDWGAARRRCLFSSKIALVVALGALTLTTLPALTTAAAAFVSTHFFGEPSIYTPRYRPIEGSTANAELWASAISTVGDPDKRRSLSNAWAHAAERAKDNHSTVVMVGADDVDTLAKRLSVSGSLAGSKRRDAAVTAMVDELLAGGSDSQAMAKARQALALVGKAADPISRLPSRFGPVQSCPGLSYVKTMLPYLATPAGACMAMTNSSKAEYYMGGLLTMLATLAVLVGLGYVASRIIFAIHAWSERQSEHLMARWEQQEMESSAPRGAPIRRARL